jgi:hypothetical protein
LYYGIIYEQKEYVESLVIEGMTFGSDAAVDENVDKAVDEPVGCIPRTGHTGQQSNIPSSADMAEMSPLKRAIRRMPRDKNGREVLSLYIYLSIYLSISVSSYFPLLNLTSNHRSFLCFWILTLVLFQKIYTTVASSKIYGILLVLLHATQMRLL